MIAGIKGIDDIAGAPGTLVVKPVHWDSGVRAKSSLRPCCESSMSHTIADMTIQEPVACEEYEKFILCEVVAGSKGRFTQEGKVIDPVAKKGQGVLIRAGNLEHCPSTADGTVFIDEYAVVAVVALSASHVDGEEFPNPENLIEN